MSKPRFPNDAERELWHQVAAQFSPLKRKSQGRGTSTTEAANSPTVTLAPLPLVKNFKPRPPIAPPPSPPQANDSGTSVTSVTARNSSQQMDKNLRRRLMRGQIPIEARLDLHGMRLEQGRLAVRQFLARAFLRQMRCVLIITGKGRQFSDGEDNPAAYHAQAPNLRSELPRWLQEKDLAHQVLALSTATPQDGGSGAWYVLLRRQRSDSATEIF